MQFHKLCGNYARIILAIYPVFIELLARKNCSRSRRESMIDRISEIDALQPSLMKRFWRYIMAVY